MFRSIRESMLVVAAWLLCGTFVVPSAHAGIIKPSEIQGDYHMDTLGSQPQGYPVTFTLSDGQVTTPAELSTGFSASALTVTISRVSPLSAPTVNLGSSITIEGLIGGTTETIVYSITPGSGRVINSTTLAGGLTLSSNTTSPNPPPPQIDLSILNPAVLLLIFPPTDVDFDPRWSPPAAPVEFEIIQTPEPTSLVHLTWVGVLVLLDYRTRHRCRASVATA